MDRDREPAKTESEPCHTQLWSALEGLDDAVEKMRLLYDRLAGMDKPVAEQCEKESSPSFASVLLRAIGRVNDVRGNVHKLREDFEQLCFHGATE